MSSITKPLIALFFAVLLLSCNKASDPKEVSVAFIESLNQRDFGKALSLATPNTREYIAQLKTDQQVNAQLAQQNGQDVKTVFALDSLKPYKSGNSAIVKNDIVTINLDKVEGEWMVVASQETVTNILYRSERLGQAKLKWEALQGLYSQRTELLKEYINYVNTNGRSSASTKNLEEALAKLPPLNAPLTKENMAAYVQAQDAIEALADKAVQPVLNASADLTMNYIINLGEQTGRIKEAKAEYNKAAAVAHSKVYGTI